MATWTAGDWISSNGTIWQRVQNSTSPYLPLAGGNLGGTLGFSDGTLERAGSGAMPDMARWWRDAAGNIALGIDYSGLVMAQRLQVFGLTTFTGNVNATGSSTFNTLTPSILSFLNGDIEQVGSSLVPDLSRWVRDAAGNIIFAFSTTGDTIVNNLQVQGTLTAPGFSGGGGSSSGSSKPADALDITDPKYGAKGDGSDDVFTGTWAAVGNTLMLGKYAGAVVYNTTGNALTLNNTPTGIGPGFDPNIVGKFVYIGATDGSGVAMTTQITGWVNCNTVSVADNPSATVTAANVCLAGVHRL